jgi:competence protein ComEC
VPRTGWLAAGAVAAALLQLEPGSPATLPAPVPGLVLGVGLVLLACLAVAARRDARPAAAAAVGALAIAVRLALGGSAGVPPAIPDGTGPWHAQVEQVGSPRDGQQVATVRLDPPLGLRIAATMPSYPLVAPGDRVELTGRLLAPGDDDYGAFLRRTGVAGTVRATSLRAIATAGPPDAPAALESLRRGAGDALAVALPEPAAGLAAGILIGLRDRVDRDLAAAFTTAGVSHVVAISGWNIAIVGGVVGALLHRASRRRRSLAILLAVVAYTAFAGASPSVLRAAAMAAVVLLARESGRAGRAAAALGAATAGLLLVDPGLARDAGMQLSVLATAGLLVWAAPIRARLDRLGAGRLPDWLAESLSLSTAAQMATLPVILATFGRLSLISPLANLAVAPIVPAAMAGGALALAGGLLAGLGAPIPIAAPLALPGWLALGALIAVVRVAAAVPAASVELAPPLDSALAAIAGLAMLAMIPAVGRRIRAALSRSRPRIGAGMRRGQPRPAPGGGPTSPGVGPARREPAGPGPARQDGGRARQAVARWVAVALAAAVALTVLAASARPDGRIRLSVLDVGQGDAILIEGERGGRLLVDGGPDGPSLLTALDERIPPWDRRIDVVVVTHPHEDHVGGLPALLERYRVGRAFENGMRGPGPAYEAWRAGLAAHRVPVAVLAAGDTLAVDSVRLRVLWPDRGSVPADPPATGSGINDHSVVLLGEAGGGRFLLTGDTEEGVDPVLGGRGLPRVDLLKVAHHGSRTATSGPFLDAVRPAFAFVSVGAGNDYGHPSTSTLARISARHARILRTDEAGTIVATFDGRAWTVAAGRAGLVGAGGPIVATALGYDAGDARTRSRRSGLGPALPPSGTVVRPPLARRRGGRELARIARRTRRSTCRPAGRRGRGPPARRG